jgi:hypothetical protein
VRQREDRIGDVWEPVLGPGIDLMKMLAKFSRERRRLT